MNKESSDITKKMEFKMRSGIDITTEVQELIEYSLRNISPAQLEKLKNTEQIKDRLYTELSERLPVQPKERILSILDELDSSMDRLKSAPKDQFLYKKESLLIDALCDELRRLKDEVCPESDFSIKDVDSSPILTKTSLTKEEFIIAMHDEISKCKEAKQSSSLGKHLMVIILLKAYLNYIN